MISFRGKLVTDERTNGRTDGRTAANLLHQPPKVWWVQKYVLIYKQANGLRTRHESPKKTSSRQVSYQPAELSGNQ